MWRNLVSELFEDAEFSDPADPRDVEQIEAAFALTLPGELKSLLGESDGILAHYGTAIVWPTDEMLDQNRLFRESADLAELYMPFDGLLFFGAEGDGSQFGYRVLDGRIRETSWIFKWDHESDNREWFAGGLADYLKRSVPTEN